MVTPFPIPSTGVTPSEVWSDVLKPEGKNNSLWPEYNKKAAEFDERVVDEWNKIVDVLLVYVSFFLL